MVVGDIVNLLIVSGEWKEFTKSAPSDLLHRFYAVVDWKVASKNRGLTLSVLDRFQDRLDWDEISLWASEEIILKFHERINPKVASRNKNLPISYVIMNKIDWKTFSEFASLEIIRNFHMFMDKKVLSKNKNLELKIIRKYDRRNVYDMNTTAESFNDQNIFDWDEISRWAGTDILYRYTNLINWDIASRNKNLTMILVVEFLPYLDLCELQKVCSKDILIILRYKIILDFDSISENKNIDSEFIRMLSHVTDTNRNGGGYDDGNGNGGYGNLYCSYCPYATNSMNHYEDFTKFNWDKISVWATRDILESFESFINFQIASDNRNLTKNLIQRNITKVNWEKLCEWADVFDILPVISVTEGSKNKNLPLNVVVENFEFLDHLELLKWVNDDFFSNLGNVERDNLIQKIHRYCQHFDDRKEMEMYERINRIML